MVQEDLNLKNCQFTGLIKINFKLWRIMSKLTFKEISDRIWQSDRGPDSKWCELFTAFVSLFWWCRCEARIGFRFWRLHFDFFLTSIRTSHHFCLRKSGIFKSENRVLSSWNQQFVIALKRRFLLCLLTYMPKNAEKRRNYRVLYRKSLVARWFTERLRYKAPGNSVLDQNKNNLKSQTSSKILWKIVILPVLRLKKLPIL